jgi:2-amino-4-hydroxy-6-hydroxymethyldihydropteridine diphosphokinase
MEIKKVTIAIGTNLGNREQLIADALNLIANEIGEIIKCSPFYLNKPQGFVSNEIFLNGCIIIESALDSNTILQRLQIIEDRLGRLRIPGNGYMSRTIDLDIILLDDEIIHDENLTIPHPRFRERLFVLKPLYDIHKNAIDPITGKSIEELKNDCQDSAELIFHELNVWR